MSIPINFLTLNMGDIDLDVNGWKAALAIWDSNQDGNHFLKKEECWVICSQEDTVDSPFMQALQAYFAGSGTWIKSDLPRVVMAERFYVHIGLFVPREYVGVFPQPTFHNVIKHDRKKMTRILSAGPFVFVGSHLPFFKYAQSWDYGRRRAMKDVLDYITSDERLYSKTMFMMGDLNFRFIDGKDQLNEFIEELRDTYNIRDLSWGDGMHPSCKMKPTRTPNCHKGVTFTSIKHPSSVSNSCYNSSRKPSLCDRVLMMGNVNVAVQSQQHVTFAPITDSDHNAVHVQVNVDMSGLLGGGGKGRQKVKKSGRVKAEN